MKESNAEPLSWWTENRLILSALVVLLISFYSVSYWSNPLRPVVSPDHPKAGWKDKFDQAQYYKSITALEVQDYNPSEYHYPLGYPLLASLSYGLNPDHPFFIPDLVCYVITGLAFWSICRLLLLPWESLILCFFALMWPVTVTSSFVVPWTNTPTCAASLTLVCIVLKGRRDKLALIITGVCTSVIFTVRPGDVIFSWPLLVPLWLDTRDSLEIWKRAKWFFVGALPLTAVFIYLSLAIHGSLMSTAYARGTALIGFSFAPIGLKLYTMLVDGFPFFGENRTLINAFPVLLLTVPGITLFVRKFGFSAMAVLAAQTGAVLYYLAYNDFWIVHLFYYGAIRYWLWLIPLWCLFSYLSVRSAWRELGWLRTLLMVLVPLLAWTLPELRLRQMDYQLKADSRESMDCQPAPDGSCTLYFSLLQPADFDVLRIQGVSSYNLTYAQMSVDGHISTRFRDFFTGDGPEGKTLLMFYRRQHGSNFKLTVPPLYGNMQQHFKMSRLEVLQVRGGMALHNPFRRYHSRG